MGLARQLLSRMTEKMGHLIAMALLSAAVLAHKPDANIGTLQLEALAVGGGITLNPHGRGSIS